MILTKIQYFAAWGYEDWHDLFTDDIEKLIENQKSVNNDGIIHKTNNDSADNVYFYMIDKFGHVTFYRMDETKFNDYYYNKKVKEMNNNNDAGAS